MRGKIVALPTQVIPPQNTPRKTSSDTLIAHPRWRYIGPGDIIRFEWQIGRWGLGGFAGETARKSSTHSQPASTELNEFTTSLPSISLSPLTPSDDPYDCEIWFKDTFPDLRVIVENCVEIVQVGGYSDIWLVTPSSAEAGITVTVLAYIKNLCDYPINLTATMGRVNGEVLRFGTVHKVVDAGQTEFWYDSFIMPDHDVIVSVESWYEGTGGIWYSDDRDEKTILRA